MLCSNAAANISSLLKKPLKGKIPEIAPEWMSEENGIWVDNKLIIIDLIADFIQNWLEDNINLELYEKIKLSSEQYQNKELFRSTLINLFDGYFNTRCEALELQLTKLEE